MNEGSRRDALSLLLTRSESVTAAALTHKSDQFASVIIMEVESSARNLNGLQEETEICEGPEVPKRSDVKVYKEFCDFYVRL